MRRWTLFLMFVICCSACVTVFAQDIDPLARLKQVSAFPKIDVKLLLDGEILSKRGPLMTFPTGISSQLCFAVPTSPAETVKRLQTWDPTRCSSLKVYAAHDLNDPAELKEFNNIHLFLEPGDHPVRWLWDQTLATTDRRSDLNLTRVEAQELARCVGKSPDTKTMGDCWGQVLFARLSDFQRNGFASSLSYEFDVAPINPAAHLLSLVQEQPLVAREFVPLLRRAGLVNGAAAMPSIRPTYYWRLFEAGHHATFSLGTVYLLDAGDHYKLLDIEYYVSGTYYTSATLYEIWPIRDGERRGSLVWCNVLCSAPMFRFASGIERLASSIILTLEFKKCVRCFQES
ncbi:hypothetical protein [Pelobacter propionicus]|uniref:Uncharacterized protein n=1 Tax=Pelobacter propionicus (strain DSM 2379 / NBRC 103807 / OttBd1) TaxID=338966 RepID=A1ALA8_PELPD|nr:hypothetical protein [Pelobacter propionicus]ABK98128.1 hypothetical protein Ppro_0497 [Pelobacter propionicus DSM 2379]